MNNPEVLNYIKKSFELKNQGFYKPAIEMLYKALSIDCDNIEILAQLAHLYKLLGNYQRAIYYIEKVLDINSKHIDCMLLLEEIYLSQGDLKLAKEISEKIYVIQPTSINLAKRINLLNKLQDFDAVIEVENSITNLDDDVLYEIACAYSDNYEPEKAIELLELGYAKNNKNEKIMLLLGKILYDTKHFEKAKKIFTDLQKINSTAEVLNFLGLFSLNENNSTQAVKYFSKAQKLNEKNAEYAYNLASAYFLNGWLDEALKYFNQAVCLDSDNIDYHYSLGYLYYQKKMYDKALTELNFINSIEQHHELSNVLRAMIIAKKGDLLGAKNQLENIIKYNEADDFAYSALSKVYRELSQIEQAKQTIEHAIELNPKSLDYLNDLAEIEFEQKNYTKALELANKIIQNNEKYLSAYISIAKINLELDNFDKVFDAAQDIIELDSNCPDGYYYNALALFEQGDKVFAVESLKKSISLDLNNALLYVKMSEFYQDLGDFKNAYGWAKEASEIDERNYKYKWLCAKLAATTKNEEKALKYYSQSYRQASFDKDLSKDYANYLKSVGKEKQAEKLLKK